MTIKDKFIKEFKACKARKNTKPKLYKLDKLNSPVTFSVDDIADQISQELGKKKKKRCDEFVFCDIKNATGIYCIEIKEGNNIKLPEIRKQIQNGARIIEKRLSPSEAFGFMPVLATRRGMPITYLKNLKKLQNESKKKAKKKPKKELQEELKNEKHKIKFREITERYYIRHVKDGDSLEPISLNSIITPG